MFLLDRAFVPSAESTRARVRGPRASRGLVSRRRGGRGGRGGRGVAEPRARRSAAARRRRPARARHRVVRGRLSSGRPFDERERERAKLTF
eukprot:24187-Pelagococcus_subviridis.AAC.6